MANEDVADSYDRQFVRESSAISFTCARRSGINPAMLETPQTLPSDPDELRAVAAQLHDLARSLRHCS